MNGEMLSVSYKAAYNNQVTFNNKVDYCVGTGRMGLALQKEYYDQLKYVQDIIGFKHIRGHGLFTDDMAIYHEYEDENGNICCEYNFTYLDLVMDAYVSVGLKPFIELGFMPDKLASGEQTVFYWKGNVTPPKSYEGWCNLIKATLMHLMDRYGRDEVVTWPVEVWNEPNLPGFWKGADMEEYFKLFKESFYAIKEVDERFRVGGPAICGVNDEEWIRKFMEFCHDNNIPVDFITRHHYTTEMPEHIGHYSYQELTASEFGKNNLHVTRQIVDSFSEYKGSEIHITEFNTSYVPNNPIHDTNQNAAYMAGQLSWLGDDNASYSYWTFGDIFEEQGVPFTPFHGGFGMVANGIIPKPTFWTFAFYKKLSDFPCIHRSDEAVIVRSGEDEYRGIIWNSTLKRTGRCLDFACDIDVQEGSKGEYSIIYSTVDEKCCNPYKVWHDMGEPSSLTELQKEILRQAAVPFISSERIDASDGKLSIRRELDEFAVVYFECKKSNITSDRGFSYERAVMLS